MNKLTTEFFDTLWQDSMPKDGMQHTKETWDEIARNWKNDPIDVQKKKDESNISIIEYLEDKGILTPDVIVADIGCGMGIHTIEFAKRVRSVLASDISSVMIDHCKGEAKKQGLTNIEYSENDFLTFDTTTAGWDNKFDLVFTSLTPAMSGLESVNKLNKISKKWGFNNSFVTRKDSLRNQVLENIFDRTPDDNWGNSSPYCLFNILWLNNNQPEMTYHEERITYEYDVSRHLAIDCVQQVIRDRAPSEDEINRTLVYLESIADANGKVQRVTESLFAWTLWRV